MRLFRYHLFFNFLSFDNDEVRLAQSKILSLGLIHAQLLCQSSSLGWKWKIYLFTHTHKKLFREFLKVFNNDFLKKEEKTI